MMPRLVLCVLSAVAGFAAPATAAPDAAGAGRWASDTPWRSGLIYSVYDPAYGRASPEVRRDQNANNRPLRMAQRTWQHGFGCRGFSIIEFDVPAGVTGVTGLAGIDDETVAAGGDTYFSVWADGKRLWQSPALSRDDAPVRFTVPLNGSRQVKLMTDAQAYSNGDLADWCDVRWIGDRAPAKPEWSYAPEPGKWHVRAELHPFHLLYRGEDLTLSVATALAGDCRVTYDVSGDTGTPPSKGECTVHLTAGAEAATGSYVVPLGNARNGFYRAKFRVDTGDRTVAQREIRFGIMEPSPKRTQEGTIFGVNHHEFVSSFEPIAAAGIEWSRHWFCWSWIEPQKGEWRWNWHDERMTAAGEFGLKTIGVLGGIGQPAWSSPDHVPDKSVTTPGCPKDMADWEEYVRQVATRYRGKIHVWESWNEISYKADPGLDGWSVEKYVELHRRTYRILKEIDPENKVLVSADSLAFVDRCLKTGLDKAYDGVVVHPYRPGNSPEAHCGNALAGKPADVQVMFQDCRAWLSSRPRPDAEIWATEIGWALTGNDWPTVSEEEHGQYLARTYLLTHGAGCVANLCWHDFSLGMFGICDGQGFPRPAMLSYAALTSRLTGAAPVRRCEVEAPVHGMLFHRGDVDVLALWSERPGQFVELSAPTERQLMLYDMFGNSDSWTLREQGRYLSLSGRVVYLEGPILSEVMLTRVQPIEIQCPAEVMAGRAFTVQCRIRNGFADPAELTLRPDPPPGIAAAQVQTAQRLRWQAVGETRLAFTVAPETSGMQRLPITITLPDRQTATFTTWVRTLAPVTLQVQPFAIPEPDGKPVDIDLVLRNRDERPVSGELTFRVPDGFEAIPASMQLSAMAPRAELTPHLQLRATRKPHPQDQVSFRLTTDRGARAESSRTLTPTIADADNDGVADGWRLNPENTGTSTGQGNAATGAIETGDAEFHCQKIDCTRFVNGWIILSRDGQDRIARDRRYRVTFRARQQGLTGTVGVAVYNVKPWQGCGLERQFRVGEEWQTFSTDFTATRDSTNARFEFFFTEPGTLWIEGMRLEAADGTAP